MQSTYLKNQDANWVKGTTYPSAPTALYFSLHTANPSLTGTNEIVFSRVAATTFGTIATAGTKRQFPVNQEMTFVNSPITGSATHWGVWDTAMSGNFLGGGEFFNELGVPTPISLTTGNDATIASGSIFLAYNIGTFSNYFIDAKLNWLKGVSFPSSPANIYVGTGLNLASDGTGTDSGLSREVVTWGASLTTGNYVRIQSNVAVDYGGAIAETTLNRLAFYDSLTLGNLLWVSQFAQRTYTVGQSIDWLAGQINVEF